MKRKTFKILGERGNGKILLIQFIDELKYKLQHPGNRTKLQWEQECFSLSEGVDREKLLDYWFENIVIAENHEFQPNLDNVSPKELETWEVLLRRFLGGELNTFINETGADDERNAGECEKAD